MRVQRAFAAKVCLAIAFSLGGGCDENTSNSCGENDAPRVMAFDSSSNPSEGLDTSDANSPTLSFVSIWTTDNLGISNDDQIALPLTPSGTYDFTVDWGDGTSDHIDRWDQPETTHTYTTPGTYTIAIRGTIEGWQFGASGVSDYRDARKFVEISQWGPLKLGNVGRYFEGATTLVITATDVLDLTGTTNLGAAFLGCKSLTSVPSMNAWDVSSVTDMRRMFWGAEVFDQNVSQWDVSNVTTMEFMFSDTTAFNQDLSMWDVSNVTDMSAMFSQARAFNQDLSMWDVSKVRSMAMMFNFATAFDQDLSRWDISNVGDMMHMFSGVALSTANYDALLNGWSSKPIQKGLSFHAGNSKYSSAAVAARQSLIDDHGWSISDGGRANQAPTTLDLEAPKTQEVEATHSAKIELAATPCRVVVNYKTRDLEALDQGRIEWIVIEATAERFVEPDTLYETRYTIDWRSSPPAPIPLHKNEALAKPGGQKRDTLNAIFFGNERYSITYIFDDAGRTTRSSFEPSADSNVYGFEYHYECGGPE